MDKRDVVDVIERAILENARIQNSFVPIEDDGLEKTLWINRTAIESVSLIFYDDKKDNRHYKIEIRTKSSREYTQTYSESDVTLAEEKAEALLDIVLGLKAEVSMY